MPLPTTAPEHLAGSDEPESFAILGWRLATLNGGTVCERPISSRSADCAACSAALASLVLEEQSACGAYLYNQVSAWKDAGLLSTSVARRVWHALERRRQQIPVWLDGWRERLESWG